MSSVQNLTKAKTLTRFKKSHYKIKKTDPRVSCWLVRSDVQYSVRGERAAAGTRYGAAFQEGGCARSSRLKLVSGVYLRLQSYSLFQTRSSHSLALSVLSPTIQLSSKVFWQL